MPLNTKDYILVNDCKSLEKRRAKIFEALDNGKTILISWELGDKVIETLANGYASHLQANAKLKEVKENCGVCGCGKTANVLVWIWRE